MDILYLAHSAPLFRELAGAIARNGHKVSFIGFYDSSTDPFYDSTQWSGIDVYTIPKRKKWRFLAVANHLRQIIKRVDPDVFHCHYAFPYGIHGALAFRKNLVLSLHGTDAYYHAWRMSSETTRQLDQFGLGPILFASVHRFLASQATQLILGSPDLVAIARTLGYRPEQIRVCDIGVDLALFNPELRDESLRRRFLKPYSDGYVIFSSRGYKAVYAPLDLVRALRKVVDELPRAVLVLAGLGPDENLVRREIDRLKLRGNVKMVGLIPHEEIGRYMGASDVLCSVALSDTSAMSVLEGMSCGLPILATKVGSIPERLGLTQGGIVVEPGDVNAIADGLLALLRDANLRKEMGTRNAAFIAQTLTFAQTVERHIKVYEELA